MRTGHALWRLRAHATVPFTPMAQPLLSIISRWSLALALAVLWNASVEGGASAESLGENTPSDSARFEHSLSAVRDLIRNGHYAAADSLARSLLPQVERERGAESLEAARLLDELVEALRRSGKATHDETWVFARRALAIKEKLRGPDDHETARSLNGLAVLHFYRGLFEEAGALFERVLAIRERVYGPEHELTLAAVDNVGAAQLRSGQFRAARATFERSLAAAERAGRGDSLDVAGTLVNLGAVSNELGDPDRARAYFERAVAIRERLLGPSHPSLANSLNGLGNALFRQGDFAGSRRLHERAMSIQVSTLGPDHPEVAVTAINLAFDYGRLNLWDEERALLERALAINEKALGAEHPQYAFVLTEIAANDLDHGRDTEAVEKVERALSILERALGPDHPDLERTLDKLAWPLAKAGRVAEARHALERALAIEERTRGPGSARSCATLLVLGQLLAETGELEEARRHYERSLAICLAEYGEDHEWTAIMKAELARVLALLGSPETAFRLALESEEIWRDYERKIVRTLPEREALGYLEGRPAGLALAALLAARGESSEPNVTRAWDAVVRSRALVLDEMASRHHAVDFAADPALAPIASRRDAATRRLTRLTIAGPGALSVDDYRGEIDSVRAEAERAERMLLESSDGRRRADERERAGLREVLAALPEGAAIAAYLRAERAHPDAIWRRPSADYVVFVQPPGGGAPSAIVLGPAGPIDSLVAAWREEAGRPLAARDRAAREATCSAAGRALRQAIWDPIVERLGASDRVFIVPDGELQLLNFAALPASGAGAFLVEGRAVLHQVSAERDLLPRRPEAADLSTPRLLVVGDPDFDADATAPGPRDRNAAAGTASPLAAVAVFRGERPGCSGMSTFRWQRLPGTAAEVQEIEAIAKGRAVNVVLRGADATEAAFKRLAPGSAGIHLATHGFFLGPDCARAAEGSRGMGRVVEESPADAREHGTSHDTTRPDGPPSDRLESALRLSGLVLAGGNRREEVGPSEEDGILTAEEIASMNLSAASWVVLSACDTGVGAVRAGEGVLGLQRAFRVAGVRTLVMSLWPVEDAATRDWMSELYAARFQGGLEADRAVAQASRARITARRAAGESDHPFYWAGFVATGDWR